jgi:hypothetical protein
MGGSQGFDARIHWSGPAVESLGLPRVRHAEVTTVGQPGAHLVREHLQLEGGGFSAKGTYRDPETRKVVSEPVAESNADVLQELLSLLQARVAEKSAKAYPPLTSLIVACEFESPLDPGDWRELVARLRPVPHTFAEVVLVDEPMFRVETL